MNRRGLLYPCVGALLALLAAAWLGRPTKAPELQIGANGPVLRSTGATPGYAHDSDARRLRLSRASKFAAAVISGVAPAEYSPTIPEAPIPADGRALYTIREEDQVFLRKGADSVAAVRSDARPSLRLGVGMEWVNSRRAEEGFSPRVDLKIHSPRIPLGISPLVGIGKGGLDLAVSMRVWRSADAFAGFKVIRFLGPRAAVVGLRTDL